MTIKRAAQMKSIDNIWQELSQLKTYPAFKRVDDNHPCDLYAAVEINGAHGLFLVSLTQPPIPQSYEAVEITRAQRQDGKWILALKLHRRELLALFTQLCNDLIEASRGIDPQGDSGAFLLSRVARWRRLLEFGKDGSLSEQELRGLIGELVFMNRFAIPMWPPDASIEAWVGPFDASQDFCFPDLSIEVKTIRPGSPTVKISSIAQLDTTGGRLLLAVLSLSASTAEDPKAVSVANIVDDLRCKLAPSEPAAREFNSRLAAAGYVDSQKYENTFFRVGDIRLFEIKDNFPRLTRRELPEGVVEARYDISLAACANFEISEIERGP